MYIGYNAKSLGVQYNYAQSHTAGEKTSKSIDVRVDYQSVSVSESSHDSIDISTKSLKDAAEKMLGGNGGQLAEIIDKIRQHTEKNYERQSETVLAEIKSFSISIKISMVSEAEKDITNAAKELTSDNGYFGVKKTSERIFNFAAGISGDNIEMLKKAKEGIEKGFEKVRGIFGAALPDITEKTHDAVMEKMDAYMAELEKSAEKAYA